MSDDSENVGIPVALVDADTFNDLYQISLWGHVDKDGETLNGFSYVWQIDQANDGARAMRDLMFSTIRDDVTPLAPWLEMLPFLSHADDRMCMIVIANGLAKPLKLSGDPFIARGHQVGHPDTQVPRAKGGIDHSDPDIIPGRASFGTANHYGVGVYRFAKLFVAGIGFYGTEGAITLTTDDPAAPKPICIAWRVDQFTNVSCAATMDVTQYGTGEDFYNATVAQNKGTFGEGLYQAKINCTIAPLTAKGKTFPHLQVVTAVIQPSDGIAA